MRGYKVQKRFLAKLRRLRKCVDYVKIIKMFTERSKMLFGALIAKSRKIFETLLSL